MTIETFVALSDGNTYNRIHPAGLSYYDQPPETVTKTNSSIGFVVGDLAVCDVNTSSGETWRKAFAGSSDLPLRKGIVTIASGSGTATLTIKRVPFQVVSATAGGDSSYAGVGVMNGGDQSNSRDVRRFDNRASFTPLPLSKLVKVVKPSTEVWNFNSIIYGYFSAGVILYTSDAATASASATYFSHGQCCLSAGVGVIESYCLQLSFYEPTNPSSLLQLSKSNGSKSIQATVSGGTPAVFYKVYASQDLLTISISPSATCSIFLGLCVGRDNSTSPPTINYFDTYGYQSGCSMEAIEASIVDNLCFIEMVTNSAIPPDMGTTIDEGFPVLAWKNNAADATKNIITAPIFSGRGQPVFCDLAYDPILPAPFDNLRIIWTASPGGGGTRPQGLYPALAKRVNRTTPPYTGMVASSRYKPERYSTYAESRPNTDYNGSSGLYPMVRESRSTPYAWKEATSYNLDIKNLLNQNGFSLRGCMFPSGTLYSEIGRVETSYQWRWETFDPVTSTWVALTSYAAGTGSGSTWTASITPPSSGVLAEEVYVVRLGILTSSGLGVSRFTSDFSYLGAFPYDIGKIFSFSDAGGTWVASAGWIWPNEPATPTVAWSNEPVFSLVGNTLSLSALTPVRTVTPNSKFNNSLVAGYPNGLSTDAPSMAITYDDGDSCSIPDLVSVGVAYSKGGISISADRLVDSGGGTGQPWVWGSAASMNVYPSRGGSKNITVKLYYVGIIGSAYSKCSSTIDDGYAVTRVLTQNFTLP